MKKDGGAQRERLGEMAGIPLIMFASFNGIALAFALYESLSDQIFPARIIISVMGGMSIATMIAYGWRMLARAAVAGDRDPHTASLGGLLAVLGITVSAWFLASLIGGDDAVRGYQSDHLEALQQQADRIAKNGGFDGKAATATRTTATEVREMASAEAANGMISGIDKGRGEWARSLEAFAATLAARATAMEEQQERREEKLSLFGKTLVEARIAASNADEPRFADLTTRAARLLTQADGIASYSTISALGTGMMAKEAKEQISATVRSLQEAADEAATQWRGEAVPFYRPISKQVATAVNADSVPGAWAVAIAFELLPLLLLLIILLRPADPNTRRSGYNDNELDQASEPVPTARDAA